MVILWSVRKQNSAASLLSYFAVFYTYKKGYMIFFPKFYGSAWWILGSKKFGKGEDQNIFC